MKQKNAINKSMILTLLLLMAAAAAFAFSGCSGNDARTQVKEDLEAMRYVELEPAVESELEKILTDSGREYFEMFLAKAGEFEYEIKGSDDSGVTVIITTYDFASEYLRSWSEFLEKSDPDNYNETELYENLFRNLSNVSDKSYKTQVVIGYTRNEDGTVVTDAKNSPELRNAILGGMLNEIAGLAEVS